MAIFLLSAIVFEAVVWLTGSLVHWLAGSQAHQLIAYWLTGPLAAPLAGPAVGIACVAVKLNVVVCQYPA